jgi:hypothetical protein
MREELLLLTERSVALRYLVLTSLVEPVDPEEPTQLRRHLTEDPLVKELDDSQLPDGSWTDRDLAWSLRRYGMLGLEPDYEPVSRAVEYCFSRQQADGSWPIPHRSVDDRLARSGYDMIPLQTALPLVGLSACGLAEDPRCEKAYQWLLNQRLEDGAWPAGITDGVYGYIAGYRRLPHSRWGCRSNTTGVLLALCGHPQLRHSPEALRALDLLLARETRDAANLGFETARLFGFERVRGLFTRFARFDPLLALELAAGVGAGISDERVADLAEWVIDQRSSNGLWTYTDGNASPFVSYAALTTLRALGPGRPDWWSNEPRTPFQPYPRPRKRW